MSRMAVLMLALSSPVALADTGDAEIEDTGAGEDTDPQDRGEEEDDTESSDGSTSSGDDTGETENVPNGVDPEILDEDPENTGSSGNPENLSGVEEPTACGGSMALLFLPLMLGWRYRGS